MSELPIACSLDAETLATRANELLPGLAKQAAAREPIDDGVRLGFAGDSTVLESIAHVIESERRCCTFLRFVLTVEPRGSITLDVTGPAGTRDFLSALIDV